MSRGDMEHLGTLTLGVILWHLAALNSLSLVSGAYAKSRWFLPPAVVFSRYHLLGVLAACFAIVAPVVGDHAGSVATGFVFAALFGFLDTYFIYRAVKQR